MFAPLPAPKPRARTTPWGRLDLGQRRTAQSWKPAEELGQPQDGAIDPDALDAVRTSAASRLNVKSARDPREPEDARLTGGTRSLMRRVLGLNVTRPALSSLRTLPAWVRKPALQ